MEKLKGLTEAEITKRHMITYAIILASFAVIGFLVPENTDGLGIISIIPAAFLLIFIFKTKRIIEALALASLLTTIMGYKMEFYGVFNEILLDTMMNEDIAWLIIVCGTMGGIVAVIEKSGGGYAFGNWVVSKAKTKRSSLLWTSFCSLRKSLYEYMN